jgi:hypothetical protein
VALDQAKNLGEDLKKLFSDSVSTCLLLVRR